MDPEVLELNAHSELCVNQAYCLHGGTCYRLMALGRLYCQCPEHYEGERCHLKTVNFPDLEESKHYEEIRLTLSRLLPVAIAITVAIVFMFVLLFIYLCAKKCHQRYRHPSAVKIPIYQNASAQTSISQLCLLSGDHQCNGHLASGLATASRTRLIGCSATPNSLQGSQKPSISCLDLESGCRTENDLEESVHASTNRWPVLTVASDATEAYRDIQRGGTDQGINAPEESATRGLQWAIHPQEASTRCLSPNDSNNNTDVFAFNSPRRVTDEVTAIRNERTWHSSRPGYNILGNSAQGFDSANTKTVNDDLYDSDPEATAL